MVFFSRPNKIKLRWIKFSSRPCVPLFLANVNRGNWNVIQILIYFLQPICYGRKEKIFEKSPSTSPLSIIVLWRLKIVPERVLIFHNQIRSWRTPPEGNFSQLTTLSSDTGPWTHPFRDHSVAWPSLPHSLSKCLGKHPEEGSKIQLSTQEWISHNRRFLCSSWL